MIVIIGGGISGLALGHHLAARGRSFVILEASARAGGVMRSGVVDGHVLEWGPQRGRLTADFAALVDELQLRDRLITAPRDLPLFVYRRGALRRVPFSPGAFVRSNILSLHGKMRLLAEPLTSAARDEESVAAFFTRKLGREAYENLVGPLYGGLYASDPAEMVVGLSLRHVLREFDIDRSMLLPLLRRGGTITPPDACSFVDGMETLPRALYASHREHVRLQAPVAELSRSGSGYVVRTADESFDATHVVVTVPAPAASRMLRSVAPEAAAGIGALHYNPLAVVHVHSDAGMHGLGYQVSFAEPLITRGVTFNESLFGREGVYTIYLGGARNAWVATESRDKLGEIALREFRHVTGADARVLSVEHESMPAWDRSWASIRGLQLPPGLHVHANWESRPGIPGRLANSRRLAERLADLS